MKRGLSRREFIKAGAAGSLLLAIGAGPEACSDGRTETIGFLNEHERATLGAAAERIVPADDSSGAIGAGVVDYVDRLLSAFDYEPPRIFAGGPFSGRQPYGDYSTGQPSDDHPTNNFEQFLPLTRQQGLAWRIRVYGSNRVNGGDFNDSVLGPATGLRHDYTEGLRLLDSTAQQLYGATFASLSDEQQDAVLAAAPIEFMSTLVEHTIEGMYAAPEYGGNRELTGWRANRFEGDSQPLGYSVYDSVAQTYRELAEHPVSTPNPEEDPPFDEVALEVVGLIVAGTGGERFF